MLKTCTCCQTPDSVPLTRYAEVPDMCAECLEVDGAYAICRLCGFWTSKSKIHGDACEGCETEEERKAREANEASEYLADSASREA